VIYFVIHLIKALLCHILRYMESTHENLPDDIHLLKRIVLGKNELIAQLTAELMRYKRWNYGRSAERLDDPDVQPQLALDDLPVAETPALSPVETVAAEDSTQSAREPRIRPTRRASRSFPADLPRETIVHAPASCDCPDCGAAMRTLGEDVSEMLHLVPSTFKVIRHVRPKLSCSVCSRVVQQDAPARPIVRGIPTAGLLAQVLVSKYADHCPLYRQQAIYRRVGVELDRSTMASWVGEASALLDPLVAALGRYVRSAEKDPL